MFSARDIGNAKGFLLELQAKNQTIIKVPLFSIFQQSPPLPAGFVCTLTVQKVSGNDPPLVLSSEPFPTKKVAEQDAARKMLLDVAFAELFSQATKAVTSLLPAGLPMAIVDDAVLAQLRPVCASKVVCHDLQTGMPPESEGNVFPDQLSQKAECKGQIAQEPNARGKLLEYATKNPKLIIKVETPGSVAPFVCTVTAETSAGEGACITVSSSATKKKGAEQDAAWQMLQHPSFLQLVAMAGGNPASSKPFATPAQVSAQPVSEIQSTPSLAGPYAQPISPTQHASDPVEPSRSVFPEKETSAAVQPTNKSTLPDPVTSLPLVSAPDTSNTPGYACDIADSLVQPKHAQGVVASAGIPESRLLSGSSNGAPQISSADLSVDIAPFSASSTPVDADTPSTSAGSLSSSSWVEVSSQSGLSSITSVTSTPTPPLPPLSSVTTPVVSTQEQSQHSAKEEITGFVDCVGCKNVLGPVGLFCFYQKTDTDVEFTVKHEVVVSRLLFHASDSSTGSTDSTGSTGTNLAAENGSTGTFLHLRIEDRPEEVDGSNFGEPKIESRVVCAHCDVNVGHSMHTGPEGAIQCTIGGNSKVIVCGVKVTKWSKVKDTGAFKLIERRTAATFYGGALVQDRLQSRALNQDSVVFPKVVDETLQSSPDYQYTDLLDSRCGKVPKEEQVTALHVCLQHHAIVVFPTGFGKTLVASMVMHRFHLLNPRKLVVMAEERVALVQQQSSVIMRDTGMSTMPISGNNSTKFVLSQLLSGKYNALIITAGVLHNYLSQGSLNVSDFSLVVFDECHHTGSDHLYNKIIKKIAECPEALRPRVVGLTASPLKANTLVDAYKELEELRESFLGATVYRPKSIIKGVNINDIVRHPVQLSEEQLGLQRSLVAELQVEVDKLQTFLKVHHPEQYKELVGNKKIVLSLDGIPVEWKRVTGCAAAAHYRDKEAHAVELAKKCRELVRALNDNYLLGPTFVHRSDANPAATIDETRVSGQLRALCELLTERGSQSCTLVFVDTRYCANTVMSFLQSKYPELNCKHVVGQGGDDGMLWKQQERVLVDFHRGDCKLVVCTTVLEEGLDVKGCNLVIRLGGAPTLIQVVQSKGRARDKNGELHLIFTLEEQQHFDKLMKQEDMLERVLSGAAGGIDGSVERAYMKEFMVRSEQELQVFDDSDCDSVLSSDSQDNSSSLNYPLSEDGSTVESDNRARGERSHGMTLVICSNRHETQKSLEVNLKSQPCVSGLSRSDYHPRRARSVISDPRMFSLTDSLALVSVNSNTDRFLRYFCSLWDFTVGSAAAYVLLPPSVKDSVQQANAISGSSSPTSPAAEKESIDDAEPVTVVSAEDARVFILSDLQAVSTGWFVGRQSFMSAGQLSGSGKVQYTSVHIEQGRTLWLEAAPAEKNESNGGDSIERTTVRIPAATLAKHAIVCASHETKTVTVYLTLTSAPSVFFEPKHKKNSSKSSQSVDRESNSFKISKDYRVCCPNEQAEGPVGSGGERSESVAQKDLQLLSTAPVIALTFPLAKWSRLKRVFTDPTVLGLSVLVTRVEMYESVRQDYRQLVMEAPSETAKLCQYTYATLVSDVYVGALNPAVLVKIKDYVVCAGQNDGLLQVATAAMLQLHKHLQLSDLWQDAYVCFQKACAALEETSSTSAVSLMNDDINLHEGYVLMKRILATPSRVLLMPPVPTMSNRLIRMLGNKYQLAYVKFRDEQGQAVYNEALFAGRFTGMLTNGFDVAGTVFRFLLCSNSQLREATAVFFDGSDEDVQAIRAQIIPNQTRFSTDIAKFISRLGLFCTADTDTSVVLNNHNTKVETDIFTCEEKILTDGSGTCSVVVMKKFQAEFYQKNGYYSCIIQIRSRGCKGTLLCDPAVETDNPGIDVIFRESMEKFETEGSANMCVVKVAEFNPLTLNREVINLLCAIRDSAAVGAKSWNPHSTFVEMQDNVLNVLGQMLIDPASAIDRLAEHFPRETLQELAGTGMNLLNEPLLMSMLHLKYFNDTKMLRCKHHIPVQHGALAMGAPDPAQLLQDGEIFLCVHRPLHAYSGCFDENNEYHLGGGITLIRIPEQDGDSDNGMSGQGFETFVVTGPVLMYRNPCLDPGDHRVVTAVYNEKLLFWKNVALLPAATHCVRSLSAECSGGDLDGDMFGVIWDPRLVPPSELVFQPVDYEKIAKEAKEGCSQQEPIDWNDSQRLKERIAEFVARAMSNSCLGKIAVKHLAVCDILSPTKEKASQAGGKGAAHVIARELAKCQSLAVDFPKTGVAPKIPKEANELVRRQGRPHYMEKTDMLSYLSGQSLGLLYDVVSTVACTVAFARTDREFAPDALMYVKGRETFDDEASQLYSAYEREVQSLMLRFGLQCEAEMIMGAPQVWSDEFALDHEAAAQSLAACWKALQKNYRDSFYRNLPDNLGSTRLQKASAWYRAAYASKRCLHSFAWIVCTELATIRTDASTSTSAMCEINRGLNDQWTAHADVVAAVGRSATTVWQKARLLTLNAIAMKENVFQKVKDAILSCAELKCNIEMADHIELHRYGSTMLLLCDPLSDVDLTVYLPNYPKTKARTILENIVYPAVSQIAMKSQLIKDASVPLVELLVEDGYSGTKVDISAQNMDGVYKGRLIRWLYVQRPENLLFFSSLVHWARCCGLLKGFSRELRTSPLNSGQFQALIVRFLLQRDEALSPTEEQLNDPAITTQRIETAAEKGTESSQQRLGETLMSFFLHYQQLAHPKDGFQYTWPVDGAPEHSISADTMTEVAACCRRALHCLCVSWDWGHLLENAVAFEKSRTSMQIELSPALSKSIASNKEFFTLVLRWKSKAQVKITSATDDPAKLLVQGSGSYQQIQVLRYELLRMIYSGRMVSYGAVRTMSNAYFMEGSSFLYARGTANKESMLEMAPVCVDSYLLRDIHQHREHSTLKVNDIVVAPATQWMEEFKTEFSKKMMEQMAQLGTVRGDGQVIFSVHYGKLLLLDAMQSFERSRGAHSCTEIEAAMNNIKNMKLEEYAPAEDGAQKVTNTTSEEAKSKSTSSGKSQASSKSNLSSCSPRGEGQRQKLKKHLTTAFVSGVPILAPGASSEDDSSVDKVAPIAAEYEEQMLAVKAKFQAILTALDYTECDFSRIPVSNRDDLTGTAWRIPGTTLTVPTGEWRTAVDLTDAHQLNVDLGPKGEVKDVVERFVSFVNGTLVDPAVGSVVPECADTTNGEPVPASPAIAVYDFKSHDLRFKFGIMNRVSSVKHQKQFETACPDGQAPIEFYSSSELVANLKDSSSLGGVTSKMPTAYMQAMLAAEKEFVCVRPAATLARPDMVSFARHVRDRCAFFSPELEHTVIRCNAALDPKVGEDCKEQVPSQEVENHVGAACTGGGDSQGKRRSTAKVMAIMAMGEHFEGSGLERINPFIDISLEVDVTRLLAAMAVSSQSKNLGKSEGQADDGQDESNLPGEDESQSGDSEGELLGLSELDAHIRDICDELLRVSAKIKELW